MSGVLDEKNNCGGADQVQTNHGGQQVYDILVIGGGPAGLAAAIAAKKAGVQDILVLERDRQLGGILNQCIHNGFGLHTFKEELTGPEYAGRFIKMAKEEKIACQTDTMVLDIQAGEDGYKNVTVMSSRDGVQVLKSRAVILAMGCRERPRGALNIPGFRPAGIYSAGTAQKYVNIDGFLPGKEVVILGSGDIGLIMARRMTLEGAKVKAVAELMPYSGGLKRNIVQCLHDYGIPLKLSTTVIDIHGRDRVTGVTLAKVDGRGKPIPGTEEEIACDTLLLSVGLLPENELSEAAGVALSRVTSGPVVSENLETNIPGIFACGNVLHVHDLVDFVSEEAAQAGRSAARYCRKRRDIETVSMPDGRYVGGEAGEASARNRTSADGTMDVTRIIHICPGDGVRYTVPVTLNAERFLAEESGAGCKVRFRVGREYRDAVVEVSLDGKVLMTRKRKVMAPGEMEEITIKDEWISDWNANAGKLTIRVLEGKEASL